MTDRQSRILCQQCMKGAHPVFRADVFFWRGFVQRFPQVLEWETVFPPAARIMLILFCLVLDAIHMQAVS